jgi:F-type H+/Na+-transporting ATPase subunit alpha
LKNSKPEYATTIQSNKMQLTDEAEAMLKAAIIECKKSFLASA